jgi:hypothetical protein
MTGLGYLSVGMLILVALGWSRGPRVPRSEVLVVLATLLFAWTAWRNLTPGLCLMAPLVAERLTIAFPLAMSHPEPMWSRPLGVASAGAFTVIALASLPWNTHLPTAEYPIELARSIAQRPGEKRVLNDYNVGGIVLFFGGKDVSVGIDGRTDFYKAQYISRYLDGLGLRGDFEGLVDELKPNLALLEGDSPMAWYLVDVRSWDVLGTEGEFVLLGSPSDQGQ